MTNEGTQDCKIKSRIKLRWQSKKDSNIMPRKKWWSQGESNPRPFACHANALPTEL